VVWGGRTLADNQHASVRSQRFAYDIVITKSGQTHTGDGKALSDYYCYGKPVLSPGAGVVVSVLDTLPDQAPGTRDPLAPAGNHVVVDVGHSEFVLLAHLQPHSLRVKVGDHVRAGQPVGLAGNSGNTTQPHVHVHLMNGPAMPDADGLPMSFSDFVVDGRPVARAELQRGQVVERAHH